MNNDDCKPGVGDVVSPRIPLVVAVFSMAFAALALFKVLELAQRIEQQRD